MFSRKKRKNKRWRTSVETPVRVKKKLFIRAAIISQL